ncbi:hypothetical protein CH63R_07121 [Colletotrichum higginsianum IMI 349063]|uniref:Uncharacterized protein n=1 Tax=Colletotrichum higginsianum (strain IMI 349063) TaxID=759273 RepID=A0A1B7Y8I9_COLHI|nr:hypothetical protein CH63R_07121 [Colletotrichum higginsianum IMI 349063]OBR08356.1 hypothetical protein CH63R_07121 [Colletotrichum higginsianum IMI 349063]
MALSSIRRTIAVQLICSQWPISRFRQKATGRAARCTQTHVACLARRDCNKPLFSIVHIRRKS